MASKKAITIEIGYTLTKVCEVDYNAKTHKIYNSFTVSNGAEVINDGVLTTAPEFVENLQRAFNVHRIKTKQVVFTITSSKIASREVMIPYVKENRIADVVNANATDYFPVDLSQYQLSYTILGTVGEKGSQQYKLLVIAVPSSLLSGYYELAKELKLEVAAIDYASNSIYQVVKDECAKGRHIIVKIDERASLVMAVEDSVMTFTRNVSYGVEDVMDVVMNTLCWGEVTSVEQAIRVLQRNDCMPIEDRTKEETADVSEENDSQPAVRTAKTKALEDIQDAVMPLINGISRVVDYYASRGAGEAIERILITGLGADFKGLGELLSHEVNMPVTVLKEAAGWNLMRNFKNECFSEYIACVGAAVAPLDFKQESERRGKDKSKKEGSAEKGSNWAPLAYSVFGIGLVAAAALAAVPMVNLAKVTKTNMELKAQAGSLEDIIPIYNEFVAVQAQHAIVDAMYNATESRNEELEEFLGELEDKLPSSVNVVSLSSDPYQVTINMRVQTKDDAGETVEQMRTFHSLIPDRVAVTSLVEEENQESGERTINFTVTAPYQAVGYEPEPEMTESAGTDAEAAE